jgi:hypothetical protein
MSLLQLMTFLLMSQQQQALGAGPWAATSETMPKRPAVINVKRMVDGRVIFLVSGFGANFYVDVLSGSRKRGG